MASLGAAHTVATDYSEEVLALSRANFVLNLKDPIPGTYEARPLEWGSQADLEALGGPFDLVVASDCVYKQDLFVPLLGSASPPLPAFSTLEACCDPHASLSSLSSRAHNRLPLCLPCVLSYPAVSSILNIAPPKISTSPHHSQDPLIL